MDRKELRQRGPRSTTAGNIGALDGNAPENASELCSSSARALLGTRKAALSRYYQDPCADGDAFMNASKQRPPIIGDGFGGVHPALTA